MTAAPVAVVAALRETSILFGTLIAGVVLKEHIGFRRAISACIIAGGAGILRLGCGCARALLTTSLPPRRNLKPKRYPVRFIPRPHLPAVRLHQALHDRQS